MSTEGTISSTHILLLLLFSLLLSILTTYIFSITVIMQIMLSFLLPNYLSWNHSFTFAISIKNKLGFLNGSVNNQSKTYSIFPSWMHCNNLILSWILNSVSKEIASNVLYNNYTKQVWDKLRTHFSQPDDAQIYHLQHQLNSIVQNTLYVSDYFTQLNAIWEELRNCWPLPCCACGKRTCYALKSVGDVQ